MTSEALDTNTDSGPTFLYGESEPVDLGQFREARLRPITAAGYPLHPPDEWFRPLDLKLSEKTPLTITADGRVYGHIATWDQTHIGLPRPVRPPKSRSGYAFFHTGQLVTAGGNRVNVGQITYAGGHAAIQDPVTGEPVSAAAAVAHYDDTGSAFCDVVAAEDRFGIVVAGALRPTVEDDQLRTIMASAPSGDWRPINGGLELIAVCQVNSPGFPVTRALAASAGIEEDTGFGEGMLALVAAGAPELYRLRMENLLQADLARVTARIEAVEAIVAGAEPKRDLRAEMDALLARSFSEFQRKKAADDGDAMSNGSFPIENKSDLANAVQAYGRAKDKAAAKRHIIKRAKALGAVDSLPESWGVTAATEPETSVRSQFLRQKMAYLTAGGV